MGVYSRIAGTGSYLPERVLTNADLEKMVDTSDEWIVARTGIRERRVAAEGQTTGDLAFEAAKRAMEAAGVEASEIELIVVGVRSSLADPRRALIVVASKVLARDWIANPDTGDT